MATNRCANRQPQSSQPGPNGGTPNPQPNTSTGIPHPRQQGPQHVCPGMYTTSRDHQPGPPCTSHPHTHIPPHPFMYIPPHPQPPPMPPFLQYQWPMPFSYNPFTGFPAMGYGMAMPPFPPNPYLEAPGYMLPQPHLQQVNYRRFLHAQFPATNAPYQSQNQNRRFRAQHNVSAVRETVSSEVQTEPARTENGYADGSPLAGSESGHGTNSSTPSPSGSSGRKQSPAVVENYTMAGNDAGGNLLVSKMCSGEGTVKCGSETLYTKPKAMKSQTRTPLAAQHGKRIRVGQESVSCRHGSDTNADMWSICSSDGIVPVCSSSDQENDATKERRVSFPDILMSWVGGTPPVATPEFSDKPSPKRKEKLTAEDVELAKKISCNNLMMKSKQLKDDDIFFSPKESEALGKILRLPFYIGEMPSMSNTLNDPAVLVDSIVAHIHSRNGMSQNTPIDSSNQFQEVPDNELVQDYEESALHDGTTDVMQETSSHFQFKRKMNESIWSVESLAPYVPSQDWMMQNGLLDPEVIIEEILEDVQNSGPSTQICNQTVHSRARRLSRTFSLSAEAPPMYIPPASWLADQHDLNHSNTFPLTTKQDVDTTAPSETFNMQICQMGVQTPPSKEDQLQCDQGMDPSNALASSILRNMSETTLDVREGVDMDWSSAVPSPNQETCKVTKRKVVTPCASEQVESPLSNSLTEKKSPSSSPKSVQIREGKPELNEKVATTPDTNKQLAVGFQKYDSVSPSKVDCGIQCTELREWNCLCNNHNNDGTIQATSKTSDSCRGYKAKADQSQEDCEHAHKVAKKRWARQQERHQTQTLSNKPYNQRNRQGKARMRLGRDTADLANQKV